MSRATVADMAVNGRKATEKAQRRTTNELVDQEIKLRRSYTSRRGLPPDLAVELAAIRLVLTDRQVNLKPCPGLPELL